LFWVITNREVVIPILRVQESSSGFLNLEDGTDRLSRNVGKKSPLLDA